MSLRPSLLFALSVATASAAGLPAAAQPRIAPADRADQRSPAATAKPWAQTPVLRSRVRAAPIAPFVLRRVVVENASLSMAVLEPAWRPFLGAPITSEDLLRLTDAVAAVYAAQDFAIYTVTAPAQTFVDGVVRLRVLEGHIEGVDISGPAGPRDRDLVEAYAGRLQAERPLRRSTLERYISLIRDIPGLTTDVSLTNGSGAAGVRLHLDLAPKPVALALSLNNRGSAYLGRTQAQADLFLNSVLRQGDQTRLTVALPTDIERFQAVGVQHSQPIGTDGLTLTGSLNYLHTRPKGTAIRGDATALGLQASYPLLRSYERDAFVTLSLDGVDADNAFLGSTFADDRSRAVRAALSYSARTERRLWYVSGTLSQGLDAFGARGTPGAVDLDFRKLNARAGANFALTDLLALRLAGAGQWSTDRLPGTEQFSLGGEEFGRAYEGSIIAGDYGFGLSAEVAYSPSALPKALKGSEAFAYVDGGKVWYRGRFGAALDSAYVHSAGGGVRAAISDRVVIQVEAAKALENRIDFLNRGWRGIFLVRTIF